jgi:glycogen operon protein
MHWDDADLPLVEFTAAVSRLRREHPLFRRSRFFDGRQVKRGEGEPLPDLVWLTEEGEAMQPDDWEERLARTVGVFFNGQGIRERDARGQPIVDVNFLLYFNADPDEADCRLPSVEFSERWEVVVDTAGAAADSPPRTAGSTITIAGRSVVVLRAFHEQADGDHSVAASLAAQAGAP